MAHPLQIKGESNQRDFMPTLVWVIVIMGHRYLVITRSLASLPLQHILGILS